MRFFKTTFFFIPLLNFFSSLAQTYSSIPAQSSSEWKESSSYNLEENVYNIYVKGDTIINGKDYSILFKKGVSFTPGYSIGYNYYNYPVALVRSEGGRVFISANEGLSEEILYDFTLSIGDTLPSNTYAFNGPVVIDDIDTVYLGGIAKKKFILKYPDYVWDVYHSEEIWIIEGVGHKFGLISNNVNFEFYSKLVCYKEDNVSLFSDLKDLSYVSKDCDAIMDVDKAKMHTFLKVFPNPCNEALNIQLESNSIKPEIVLINTIGESFPLTYLQSQNSIHSYSISSMIPGLYLGNIYLDGKMIDIQKIIIK